MLLFKQSGLVFHVFRFVEAEWCSVAHRSVCSLGRLCNDEMLLFVDSAGEVSEETAVQNGCHATWAH